MVKGIIFAGCSFTWGEGLELYSNYSTINYQYYKENEYHWPHIDEQGFFKPSHLEYIKSNRWPRKVANHFNTFDVVWPENGGSFNTMKSHIENNLEKYGDDISHIVVQLTEHTRDLKLKLNETQSQNHGIRNVLDKRIEFERNDISKEEYNKTEESKIWDINFGNLTALDVDDMLFNENVIDFFQYLKNISEEKNLKIKFIGTWTNDSERYDKIYDSELQKFYNKNLIRITYQGNQYRSIYELISKHWDTGGFMIFNDLPYTNNDHPSMKLHDLLAENVINKLKKDYEN